jgi:hypothetical protein
MGIGARGRLDRGQTRRMREASGRIGTGGKKEVPETGGKEEVLGRPGGAKAYPATGLSLPETEREKMRERERGGVSELVTCILREHCRRGVVCMLFFIM